MGDYAPVARMLDEKDAEIERLRAALRKVGTHYQADAGRLIHSDKQIIDIVKEALGE